MKIIKRQFGFSLVEVIIATALFGMFATALVGLIWSTYGSGLQSLDRSVAVMYAQQGQEAARSIRRQSWNLLVNGNYGLSQAAGSWQFFGSSDLLDNKFTRVITVADACRNSLDDIIDCATPQATVDLRTKKIIVTVNWVSLLGMNNGITLNSYLTTWQNKTWSQKNWTGGSGQNIWTLDNRYSSDDGNILFDATGMKLKPVGGSANWFFDLSADYLFDPVKIEMVNGLAQLKPAVLNSGQTVNNAFTTNTTGWTYFDWNQDAGDPNATGARTATQGNPGGYIYINLPSNLKNKTHLGGYWQQAFNVSDANLKATCEFDWRAVTATLSGINTLYVAVYLENTAGAPSTVPIFKKDFTTISAWENHSGVNAIDCSSAFLTAGTYYYKLAVYAVGSSVNAGPIRVGFDNAKVSWTKFGAYPNDAPSINPTVSVSTENIITWKSFSESANKNNGEVYYQLSDNDGLTWQFWNGSSWAMAQAGDFNSASTINDNISTFATTTKKINFKAFLASDGLQLVQLDNVGITWQTESGQSTQMVTSGSFVSSAFNMSTTSALSFIEWTQDMPTCNPTCEIKVQLRTAPDNNGMPGIWSDWFGANGINTFFTSPNLNLINSGYNHQWLQYRVELSGDTINTPIFKSIKIEYLP